MKRWVLVLSGLALAICLPAAVWTASNASSSPGTSPPALHSLVVWMVPPAEITAQGDIFEDGTLRARFSTVDGSRDLSLGKGVAASVYRDRDVVVVAASDWSGSGRLLRLRDEGSAVATIAEGLPGDQLQVGLIHDGEFLFPNGAGGVVGIPIGVARSGEFIQRYAVPKLAPDPSCAAPPDLKINLPSGPSVPSVRALLEVGDDVVACVSTGQAAEILNLDSGACEPLKGFGIVYDAKCGGDGFIYVVAGRPLDSGFSLKIVQVDPTSLSVLGESDTGFASDTYRATVQPTSAGVAVFAVESSAQQIQHIWAVDAGVIRTLPEQPDKTCIFMGQSVDDNVLFFGGSAHGTVARYALSSGRLDQEIPSLQTSEVNYVLSATEW